MFLLKENKFRERREGGREGEGGMNIEQKFYKMYEEILSDIVLKQFHHFLTYLVNNIRKHAFGLQCDLTNKRFY